MKILINLFLLVVLGILVAVGWFALRIWLTMRRVKKQFEDATQGSQRNETPHGRTTTGPSGERITDTRDPEKANRKIISDEEGEYIDYVED